MYAHYYKQAGKHFVVIGTSMQPVGVTYAVADRRAAKALAAQHNAKPWNF